MYIIIPDLSNQKVSATILEIEKSSGLAPLQGFFLRSIGNALDFPKPSIYLY